jgi:hypothetical protein
MMIDDWCFVFYADCAFLRRCSRDLREFFYAAIKVYGHKLYLLDAGTGEIHLRHVTYTKPLIDCHHYATIAPPIRHRLGDYPLSYREGSTMFYLCFHISPYLFISFYASQSSLKILLSIFYISFTYVLHILPSFTYVLHMYYISIFS